LTTSGTVLTDQAALAVTFVENHDMVRGDPIVDDPDASRIPLRLLAGV
jgi:hypothetical protein